MTTEHEKEHTYISDSISVHFSNCKVRKELMFQVKLL
jgi:hypothetical protein